MTRQRPGTARGQIKAFPGYKGISKRAKVGTLDNDPISMAADAGRTDGRITLFVYEIDDFPKSGRSCECTQRTT